MSVFSLTFLELLTLLAAGLIATAACMERKRREGLPYPKRGPLVDPYKTLAVTVVLAGLWATWTYFSGTLPWRAMQDQQHWILSAATAVTGLPADDPRSILIWILAAPLVLVLLCLVPIACKRRDRG